MKQSESPVMQDAARSVLCTKKLRFTTGSAPHVLLNFRAAFNGGPVERGLLGARQGRLCLVPVCW